MTPQGHRKTPVVAVFDGRAEPVRRVDYLRGSTNDETQRLVTAQAYDVAGRIVDQWDPRFHGTQTVSLHSIYSLSGTPLRTENIDAGLRCELPGLAGQRLHSWDARGSEQQTEYDSQLRPTQIRERGQDQAWATVGRLRYASRSTEDALHNRCGQLVEHYDTAGLVTVADFSLAGLPLDQGQRFLDTLELPDWPDDEAGRERLLEPARYDTRWHYDAVGDALGQTDARGHKQSIEFDVVGQPKRVHLQWSDSPTAELIAHEFRYSAAGQRLAYTAGNGIKTTFAYGLADGRLTELKATKGSDIHQYLSYLYDLVGNVTSITDHTHVVRYHANQRSEGVRTFIYDSLYRLESATGLEMSGAGTQPGLPELVPPSDLTLRTPYTQRYEYDHGGNLEKLVHSSATPGQAHTLRLTMDASSNRCLQWQKGEAAPGDNLDFDVGGNQLSLPSCGQHLTWNWRNQLQKVTQVERQNAEDDAEYYSYDALGSRMRKRQNTQAASVTHVRDVRYLPGLEIRTLDDSEELHVCTLQGPASNVRGLYWAKGRPAEIDQGQLRYSLEDHLGSLVMELDQNARLISHEGYYPFGGTAWWAAVSQVQASYKTVRYSGKERDTSGLYYYGFRYYAAWMMRWINPDPAGPVDGLNLYAMVGNNPLSFFDSTGLNRTERKEAFRTSNTARVADVTTANAKLKQRLGQEADVKKLKPAQKQQFIAKELTKTNDPGKEFTKRVLDTKLVAFAAVLNPETNEIVQDFYNLNVSPNGAQAFHGMQQYSEIDGSYGQPFSLGASAIRDLNVFVGTLETEYQRPDNARGRNNPLHQVTIENIKTHVIASHYIVPISAGVPGAHAEVQALNFARNKWGTDLVEAGEIAIDTRLLRSGEGQGDDFIACFNCAGIIPENIEIISGRTQPDYSQYRTALAAIPSQFLRPQ
ncbi:RHS repeat-associated core domain-containing protein [Pseudomonas sp. SWRI154]|uniref:RHS repeat-associated core domain-containing protein n=1 Tax=Pseudomonas sp. SWRI154 TaxID=2745501 RepID=UPI00164624C9|nr:RHS repeat-associated core domain-containing protein [Pseudomonas sp. SWRI154]MBC3363976.1 toxin [Pseudomonas sp. SWRI154]